MAGPACRVLRAHDRVRINGTERSERRRAAIRAFSRIGATPGLRPACRRLKAADEPPFLVRALADVAVSLSGPLWLPYTGVTLPASVLVITSIISCAFAVVVFILSWRYWSKKV